MNWCYFFYFSKLDLPPPPHCLSCPVCSDRISSFAQSQAKNGKQCRLFSFPQTTIADLLPLSDLSQVFFFYQIFAGVGSSKCIKKIYAVLLFHFFPVIFPLFVIFEFLHFDFLRFRLPIILTSYI